MSIKVSWGNSEKTYTLFKFVGNWTWDDYYQSIREGVALVNDCPYTVNILIDMTECRLFPQNLLTNFGNSLSHTPRPFDLAVIATNSKFIEMIAATVSRVYGKERSRFRVARSLEDARDILRQYDAEHHASSAADATPPAVP